MDLNTVTTLMRPRSRADLPVVEPGDAFLAGGSWLFSEPQVGLRRVVDLAGFGWTPLQVGADGLHIAATCTLAALEAFAAPPDWAAAGLIGQCCRALVGSFKIWSVATVGGNICLALPAGPMTALAASLDGTCTIWSPDGTERRLSVLDFVVGARRTALRPGEILREILLPTAALRRRSAFRQMSLTPLGRSASLVIGTRSNPGLDLTITAATDHPIRVGFPKLPDAGTLRSSIEVAVDHWYDDVHGAPDWRRHVSLILATEILDELAAP